MTNIEAKEIIKNALNIAVLKGCFSLDDVALPILFNATIITI